VKIATRNDHRQTDSSDVIISPNSNRTDKNKGDGVNYYITELLLGLPYCLEAEATYP